MRSSLRGIFAAAVVAVSMVGGMLLPEPAGVALAQDQVVPPPFSRAMAEYFKRHPIERQMVLQRAPKARMLPRRRSAGLAVGTGWTPLTNQGPASGLSNPLLLTDGTVIVHVMCGHTWYKLTPDASGSYVNGTWSQIPDMPFAPLYFASQILNDGRVVANGGEYNGDNGCYPDWGTGGAIFNPATNAWTNLPAPSDWGNIGDAQSVILPNGQYMLANALSRQEAILNPVTLAWAATGSNKADENDEEGWVLLPDNSVLTTDAYVNTGTCGRNSERYTAGFWTSVGNTTVPLSDCTGNRTYEVGPLVLRPGGTVVGFSGVTTGVAGTSIFTASTKTWSAGPNLPTISGDNYNLADAPAVVLPSGNILFAASPGSFQPPVHFFELDASNNITQVADNLNAPSNSGYVVNFLMLPTGQVLQTDFSNDVEIYTPANGAYQASWKPTITSMPTALARGQIYQFGGTQLSGITHGVYGDDQQAATNFPLVQLTNTQTHNIYYAKTYDFSYRGVAPNKASTAKFVMPRARVMPAGSYDLRVITNGIPSDRRSVTVN